MDEEQKEKIRQLIAKQVWRKSTSEQYKHLPHEYALQYKMTKEDFKELTETIIKYGEWRPFFKTQFKYFELDGKQYWYVGGVCINRADKKEYK